MNSTPILYFDSPSNTITSATPPVEGFPVMLSLMLGFTFSLAALVFNAIMLPFYYSSLVSFTSLMQSPLMLMKVTVGVAGLMVSLSFALEALDAASPPWVSRDAFRMLQFPKYFHPLFCAISVIMQASYLAVKILTRSPLSCHWCLAWSLAVCPWLLTLFVVCPSAFTNLRFDPFHGWSRSNWTADQWIQVYILAWIIPLCLLSLASIMAFLLRQMVDKPRKRFEYRPLPNRASEESLQRLPERQKSQTSEKDEENDPYETCEDSPSKGNNLQRHGQQQRGRAEVEKLNRHQTCACVIPEHPGIPGDDSDCDVRIDDCDDDVKATAATFPEITTLLTSLQYVSLTIWVCLFPYASYSTFQLVQGRPVNQTLIYALDWIMHVYPCVIPLIWLRDVL